MIVERFAAILLDERAVDRGLTGLRAEVFADPAVAAKACGQKILEQIGLIAILAVVAWIADDANVLHDAIGADQQRGDDRKAVCLRAGILLHLSEKIVRLGPVFQFIVVLEV